MSGCPYTWIKNTLNIFPKTKTLEASELRVTVKRGGDLKVDVSLPAGSARWLIDLIPEDVLKKIYAENIPIHLIQDSLKNKDKLLPQSIFKVQDEEREVKVWLE